MISRGTAQAQVNSIVTDSIWNQLVNKCGYLDLLEKIKAFLPADVHLQSKSEIDDFLIGKITVNFEEARQDIIKKINLKREEDEKNRIEEEKRKAAAVDLRKKRTKQVIRIELIMKQMMLNNNDHSIAEVRNPENESDAQLLLSYFKATDLNGQWCT